MSEESFGWERESKSEISSPFSDSEATERENSKEDRFEKMIKESPKNICETREASITNGNISEKCKKKRNHSFSKESRIRKFKKERLSSCISPGSSSCSEESPQKITSLEHRSSSEESNFSQKGIYTSNVKVKISKGSPSESTKEKTFSSFETTKEKISIGSNCGNKSWFSESRDNCKSDIKHTSSNIHIQHSSKESKPIRHKSPHKSDYDSDQSTTDDESMNKMYSNIRDSDSKGISTYMKNKLKSDYQIIKSTVITPEATISQDDTIWFLRAPHNLNMSSLVGKEIKMKNKSKIKVDGKRLECLLDTEPFHETIMTAVASKSGAYKLLNVKPEGVFKFINKIPKVDLNEDKLVPQKDSSIPLPEIKRRHPLFGADYEQYISLPPKINERLLNTCSSSIRRNTVCDVNEVQIKIKKKKKEKCRSGVSDESKTKKKREIGISADWDSEQVIEETLFL